MRLNNNRLLAAGVLPLLLVAGCSSGGSGSGSSPSGSPSLGSTPSSPSASGATGASDSALSDLSITTTGKTGPSIGLKHKPFSVSKTETKVVAEGKGKTVTKDQTLTVDYLIVNGSDGKQIESNFGKSEATLDLAAKGLFPGLVKGLPGHKVGSQLVVAVPPADAFGASGNSQLGIGPKDTLLFYVDIHKATTPLKSAEGTPVKPKAGLPTVKVNSGKPATITMPKKKAAPKKLVVQPLIKGKGPQVKKGQLVTVDYTGALWRNGKVFDSSIGRAPFTFQLGAQPSQVIAGWDKGLVGQPVGSRVLLIVPPSDGYGKKGQGPIKGTDTMVFSIDILAAS